MKLTLNKPLLVNVCGFALLTGWAAPASAQKVVVSNDQSTRLPLVMKCKSIKVYSVNGIFGTTAAAGSSNGDTFLNEVKASTGYGGVPKAAKVLCYSGDGQINLVTWFYLANWEVHMFGGRASSRGGAAASEKFKNWTYSYDTELAGLKEAVNATFSSTADLLIWFAFELDLATGQPSVNWVTELPEDSTTIGAYYDPFDPMSDPGASGMDNFPKRTLGVAGRMWAVQYN